MLYTVGTCLRYESIVKVFWEKLQPRVGVVGSTYYREIQHPTLAEEHLVYKNRGNG